MIEVVRHIAQDISFYKNIVTMDDRSRGSSVHGHQGVYDSAYHIGFDLAATDGELGGKQLLELTISRHQERLKQSYLVSRGEHVE